MSQEHQPIPFTSESDEGPATFIDIPVSADDISSCQYSAWYPLFSEYTYSPAKIFKSVPPKFIQYLLDDDIILPHDEKKDSALFSKVTPNIDNDYSDWEEDDEGEDDNTHRNGPEQMFPSFHEQIKQSIAKLGAVAPKLNWSSPQDATFMMINKTMKCKSATDLYLLLKSSDYINHDLSHGYDAVTDGSTNKTDFQLVLRKWAEINPSMEFRCFVRDRKLIAITQRDLNYYKFLPDLKQEITSKISQFLNDVILPKFDAKSFVLDVYIPKPISKVYLIDIDPFARQTDSLLYTWNELATFSPSPKPLFRMVEKQNSGRFASKANSQNQVPKEVVDATTNSGSLVELAQKWEKMMRKEDPDDS